MGEPRVGRPRAQSDVSPHENSLQGAKIMPVLTRTNSTDEAIAKKQTRRGTTLMEYLMMLSLIVVACLVAIGYLGTSNNANMSNSSNAINKAMKQGS
jgi:hypothetical protein